MTDAPRVWVTACTVSGPQTASVAAFAAVWTTDSEGVLTALSGYLASFGYRLDSHEPPQTAEVWVARNPEDVDAQALIARVGPSLHVQMLERAPHTEVAMLDWLEVVPLGIVEPLDAQIGEWDKLTVPAALDAALFGNSEPTETERAAFGEAHAFAPLRTYVVLDAARIPLLEPLLSGSDLPHRCLFKGKAAEQLGGVAPWIAELQPGNDFARSLFTSAGRAKDLWDSEPGLYVRSRAPMDEVWRHLRKFTRVADEQGQWFYFRFWETPVSTWLLQYGNRPELAEFVAPFFPEGPERFEIVVVSKYGCARLARKPDAAAVRPRPILTAPVRGWLKHLRQVFEFEKIIAVATRHARRENDKIEPQAAAEQLRSKREQFFGFGFWRRDHLAKLCVWELLLGPDFVEGHEAGRVELAIRTAPTPHDAITAIDHILIPPEPEEPWSEAPGPPLEPPSRG